VYLIEMLNSEPVYNRSDTSLGVAVNLNRISRIVADQMSTTVGSSCERADVGLVKMYHQLVAFSKEQARDLPHVDELISRLGKILSGKVWNADARAQIAEEYSNFWRKDLLQRQMEKTIPVCKQELYTMLPVDLVTDLLWDFEKHTRRQTAPQDFVLDVVHPALKFRGISPTMVNDCCQIIFGHYSKLEAFFV
jgi:hypothetical protein